MQNPQIIESFAVLEEAVDMATKAGIFLSRDVVRIVGAIDQIKAEIETLETESKK